MWLFLLSLLVVGSFQSHGYRLGQLTYTPGSLESAPGKRLDKTFLRYFEGCGTQRADEDYWYPQPLNGVRRQLFLDIEALDNFANHITWCDKNLGVFESWNIDQVKNKKLVHDEEAQYAAEPAAQVRLSPRGVVIDTPEVMQARKEHFRLYNEAKLSAEKAGYESDVKEEESGKKKAAKTANYQKLSSEEFQQAEMEWYINAYKTQFEDCKMKRQSYIKQLGDTQRILLAELFRLWQEEEQRKQSEQIVEEQSLKGDEVLLMTAKKLEEIKEHNQNSSEIIADIPRDVQQTPAFQARFAYNPYLVQFVSPAAVGSDYFIGAQRPATQHEATVRYYIPTATASSKSQVLLNEESPFLQTYTLENLPELLKEQLESQASPILSEQQVGSMKLVADNAEQQQAVESSTEALSELERATREHFRAHEIALEQLSLANLRNPDYKDYN